MRAGDVADSVRSAMAVPTRENEDMGDAAMPDRLDESIRVVRAAAPRCWIEDGSCDVTKPSLLTRVASEEGDATGAGRGCR